MSKFSPEQIDELLTRGVEDVIEADKLRMKLLRGDTLRVKLGIDPTSPNIHLGRSVPLLKLQDFQKLGHKIVLIIGDFTGVIGDTSDKESERPMLEQKVIQKNMKSYIEQAGKIIDLDKCEVYHNSDWLGKLTYNEICEQANAFSLSDFISRENIKKRLSNGKRVSLRELLYPLMQGYDSVEVKADVEIGGIDQKFNLLAGRELQRCYFQEPQDILMNPLIEGLDGRKMSSSWGNTVNLFDTPNDIYGKVMSLSDEFVIKYFILTTRIPLCEIENHRKALETGTNPRDIKMKLAFELTKMYHFERAAIEAQEYFVNTFSRKETPNNIPEFSLADNNIVEVLVVSNLVSSKSEARRVIEQGGVKVNGETIKDIKYVVKVGSVLRKGKIDFIKIL